MIEHFEARPAKYADDVAEARLSDLMQGYAISRLEGAPHSETALRMLRLYASGRISHGEYLQLARVVANGLPEPP